MGERQPTGDGEATSNPERDLQKMVPLPQLVNQAMDAERAKTQTGSHSVSGAFWDDKPRLFTMCCPSPPPPPPFFCDCVFQLDFKLKVHFGANPGG